MHPAWSIIFFTSVSGLGLGLAGWIVLGLLDLSRFVHLLFVSGFTLGVIGTGLLSSTLHLGHPERAWRALANGVRVGSRGRVYLRFSYLLPFRHGFCPFFWV